MSPFWFDFCVFLLLWHPRGTLGEESRKDLENVLILECLAVLCRVPEPILSSLGSILVPFGGPFGSLWSHLGGLGEGSRKVLKIVWILGSPRGPCWRQFSPQNP